jgi:hypothetical protein
MVPIIPFTACCEIGACTLARARATEMARFQDAFSCQEGRISFQELREVYKSIREYRQAFKERFALLNDLWLTRSVRRCNYLVRLQATTRTR